MIGWQLFGLNVQLVSFGDWLDRFYDASQNQLKARG